MSNFNIKLSKNEKGEKFEEVELDYTISKDTKAGFLSQNGLSESQSLLKELDLDLKSKNNVLWYIKNYLLQEGNKHRNVTYCFTNNYLNKKHNNRIVVAKMDALRGKATNHEDDSKNLIYNLSSDSKKFLRVLEEMYKKSASVYVTAKLVDLDKANPEEIIRKDFIDNFKDRLDKNSDSPYCESDEFDFISDDFQTEWFNKYYFFEAKFPEDNRYIVYYYTKTKDNKLLVICIDDEDNMLDEDFMNHYLADKINEFYYSE